MADEVKRTASQQIADDRAARLAGSGKRVRGLVVDALVDKEIEERKVAILSLFEKIGEKERELRKLESQGGQTFDLQGNVTGNPTFTKQQIDEMRKVREHIERMQAALQKAFDSDDFSKVKELGKEQKQQ